MTRELLFSVGIKDCKVELFKSSGPGGQNRNKRETAVKIIHKASGAVGVGQDSRNQHENKKNAFLRMAKSDKFKTWHRIEVARMMGVSLDIDGMMKSKNLRIEGKENGRWVPIAV